MPESLGRRLLLFLAPRLGSATIRVLGSTLRVRIVNPEVDAGLHASGGKVIYAFWHGGLLVPCYSHRGRGIAVLISQHHDGELIARTILRLGFRTARGSSTRGGAAGLRAMCEAAEKGCDLAMVPDGPRGPLGTVHPGVVALASLTGLPILPSGIAFSRCWRLNSWDRFAIPKPFSRIAIAFAEPIVVARDVSEAEYPAFQKMVRERIDEATSKAERELSA